MPLARLKQVKFNLRREPKNISDFRKRYGGKINNFYRPPMLREKEIVRVRRVISIIQGILGEEALRRGGEGVQIVFPLTSALGHGEFVRGMLKVLAPKTRVVFLVTPKHHILKKPNGLSRDDNKTAYANLLANVKRTIRPNMRTIIIDDHFNGNTFNAIVAKMKKVGIIKNASDVEQHHTQTFGDFILSYYNPDPETENNRTLNLGISKDPLGKFATDKGNLDRYNLKKAQMPAVDVRLVTKETNDKRRLIYNLGIATAKEFLELRKIEAH